MLLRETLGFRNGNSRNLQTHCVVKMHISGLLQKMGHIINAAI